MSNRTNKYIPYSRQCIDEEDIQSVVDVLISDWLTTGPMVEKFEAEVASLSSSKYGIAVSSGTAALHAAMFAINLRPGDEVIVPAISFVATANAVVFQGAVPVFCDVLSDSLLLDPGQVESKISNRTKAIIGVDYAGHPCDYNLLRAIADKHSLVFIVDACHSLGSSYCSKRVGEFSDIAVFSFHPVKSISTGEGGMVVCNDSNYARRCKMFRNHGIVQDHKQRINWRYEMQELGYNYRLTDFQCALGISQLKKLPEWIIRRNEIANKYNEILCDRVKPLVVKNNVVSAYHLYVIKIEGHRDFLFDKLRSLNIGVNVHYLPIYLHPFYQRKFNEYKNSCPIAENAYNDILSLPIFPTLTDDELMYTINNINNLLEKR